METYKISDISRLLEGNRYPGRGIIIGTSADGKNAVAAYFIMGRSANSRNRIFEEHDGAVFTAPFDASAVEDPSLIIYAAVRKLGKKLIVTNGDQTDTLYDGLKSGLGFAEILSEREFEPDKPNYTPRISGLLSFENNSFSYKMSILKSIDAQGSGCTRYFFDYPSKAGLGHFIHTYACDGNPLPSFCGEPERVTIDSDIDEFTHNLWNALDEDNKISLYVRFTELDTGREENRLINKNVRG